MILTKKTILQLFLLSILASIFISAWAEDEKSYTAIIANNSQQPWTIRFSISSTNSGYLDPMSDCANGLSCNISPGMRKTIHYVIQSEQFNGTVTITDNKEQPKAFNIYYYYTTFPKSWLPWTSSDTLWIDSKTETAGKAVSFNSPKGGYITINCNDWECSSPSIK
jgi:hypothetical protein